MRLLVQSLNSVDRLVLKRIVSGLEKNFTDTEVILLEDTLPLLQEAFNRDRNQYLTSILLHNIKKLRKLSEGEKFLGITNVDLYAPRLNFVFGQADIRSGYAVISLHRLRPEYYDRPPNREVLLDRALKEAVHEVGHLLGLGHCRNKNCVMHFSNSIIDTDMKRQTFCDSCIEKIRISREET